MESPQKGTFDMKEVISKLWSKRKTFITVWILTFALAVAWIFPKPRYYTSTVTLAPETSSGVSSGALGDIAASFGFDLGSGQSVDAFYPLLYPSLLESTDFVVGLFDVKVKTLDGSVNTDYYTYLTKHQKYSFWDIPIYAVKRFVSKLISSPEAGPAAKGGSDKADPFFLSKKQTDVVEAISGLVKCTVDKKTEVITITVTDQDRLICATMADSIRVRLQNFIIDYRTQKARIDVDYYEQLLVKAKADYENAIGHYSGYSDSHLNSVLESTSSRKSALNNEVQGKLAVYNTVTAQLQAARAKLQEHTPAFTVIQRATVPLKPAGPKRMLFVLVMLFMATLATIVWLLKEEIMDFMKKAQANNDERTLFKIVEC